MTPLRVDVCGQLFAQAVSAGGSAHALCVTCQVARPLRSKHCQVCDRCVMRFDHHCAWLGTCVGSHNLRAFFICVWSLLVMMTSYTVLGLMCVTTTTSPIPSHPLPPPHFPLKSTNSRCVAAPLLRHVPHSVWYDGTAGT